MIHRNAVFALLAALMLGIAIPSAAAQGEPLQYNHSAGIVTMSTDDLEIKVVGVNESPHFHWWDPNNPDIDYHMRFISLFEVNDTNADGVFTRGVDTVIGPRFMLPVADWDFSGFETATDGENVTAVHFNFTSTSGFDPRPSGMDNDWTHLPPMAEFDVYVQIRVHIYMDNPSEVKFDVIIDGWNWSFNDSLLVMQFTLTESNHGAGHTETAPGQMHKTGTKFQFENGYMEYEPTALAANNSLQVKASYGEGVGLEAGESVYLSFPYFGNETLIYDPILGINSASNTQLIDTPTLILIGGAVAVIAVVAIAMKIRK